MLTVNKVVTTAISRKSYTLQVYNSRAMRLKVSTTSRLRLVLPKVPFEGDKAFCSGCGAYVLLGKLSMWFEGTDAVFYTCGCGKVGR